MQSIWRAAWACTCTALALTSFGQPVLNDPNLTVSSYISGRNQPVGMAWLDTNNLLVIEKASGMVHHYIDGVYLGVVLDLAVNSASERGLLGIAIDPDFAKTKFVYLFWSESSTGADSTQAALVPLLGNRIDRFVWNGSNLIFESNILSVRSYQEDPGQPIRGNHDGGVIRFGPDGKLYLITGDTGRRGFTQNSLAGPFPDDQFGGPQPDAAHTTGVIFRLNRDGSAPTDNPFYNKTPYPTMNKVWAYGVRNGFGMAFDPLSGRMWTQENGDDTFDEMNQVNAGFNGGWIQFMGPLSRIQQFRDIEVTRPGGLQQLRWPPTNIATNYITGFKRLWTIPGSKYADPKFSWKYAVAPAGIGFVNSSTMGADYFGDMLVGASRTNLLNGYLMKFDMNNDRTDFSLSDPLLADRVADNLDKFDATESSSLIIGSGFGVVTEIQTAPNGKVILCSLDQGTLYEVRRVSDSSGDSIP